MQNRVRDTWVLCYICLNSSRCFFDSDTKFRFARYLQVLSERAREATKEQKDEKKNLGPETTQYCNSDRLNTKETNDVRVDFNRVQS